MAKVLIVCGGTGGHLTPGIAIAEELLERGHHCSLVVSRKKVDARLIQNYPTLEFVDAPGAPFAWHPVKLLKFIWVQLTAFFFALRLLSRIKPDLILGFGGFVTAGIALPGYVKGIPFALHEANRIVGRSNRFLSRFAKRVFLPDEVTIPGTDSSKIQFAGLPLRKEFVSMSRDDARKTLNIQPAERLLVVFGGSQGASALNNWAKESMDDLAQKGVSLYCLTGMRSELPGEQEIKTTTHGTVRSRFVPFSDSMPAVLSAADVVVSRAGAGSIGEIIRCGVPAILIPYPFARDDHQTANAEFVVQKDAARIVQETQLTTLMDEVNALLWNDSNSDTMRKQLKSLDRPDEAKRIAESLEEMISHSLNGQALPIPHTQG
ncbi:UDP-N-acetylglucosamine--N-acetylmuramyl-(pentapeptide) pyrophosphoryl-undecaprenol N-acetylglucosamine transferase [Opitutia bacterium ISCC 51]|nr:UDP-N-acetylglucosamine--N-acetylmuramyl-(pentapeptide) pyrophosphoryl-undecaprenol N-acetylglucosamine transferase [Opitutae bacterium ISCC 51]QXD27096.1 UDP-N-acetylglucosamine--N-acetylmuramyl-(pentapeptide) pyrophosphoryl-undecaprenol N-acetylglucosamine transferase [Opitutae bacterium ISCC 52]